MDNQQAVRSTTGSDAGNAPRNILLVLRRLQLFSQLDDDQFNLVCRLLRVREVARGDLLFNQGAQDDNLYLLRRGSVAVRNVDENQREHFIGKINAGNVFNLNSFLSGNVNEQTAEALENLTLWYIPRAEFLQLQKAHPEIKVLLVMPGVIQPVVTTAKISQPKARRYAWQRTDEVVLLYSKKHWWVFVGSLWPTLPAFIMLGILGIPEIYAFVQPFHTFILGLVAITLVIWAVYCYVDWQNDYYAVTNLRVLHRERVLLFRDDQEEVPMSKIQDVKVDRPSFFTMLFDFGDVTLDAAGSRSRVRFNDIPSPQQVAKVIFEQISQNRVVGYSSDHAKIRQELRSELDLGSNATPAMVMPPPRLDALPMVTKRWRSLKATVLALRRTALPHMRLVQGNTITYRKHWLQLLEQIALPGLGFILIGMILLITGVVIPEVNHLLVTLPGSAVVGLAALIMALWMWYQYEDWRNDIYQLTPERIIDIDRKPLGILGQSKREARLSMVQNVTSTTRGPLDLLFNMGDVVIQTASSDGKLTFDRVHNPRQVAHEILDYIDSFDSTVRELEAAQRRLEMTEWFGVYDELRRLHEAKKIE